MPALETTADAILDAAEALFARQGFAATSVKQLGAAAGVNPSLLYYYFGDKDGLYEAVLRRILGGIANDAGARLAAAPSPADAVRELVRLQAQVLTTRPHAARLLLRELVDDEARHAVPAAAEFVERAFDGLCQAIRAGQAAGIFRAELRPEYAAFSTIAQMVYVILARPLFVARLGARAGLEDEAAVRAFAEHAAEFALAALAAPPPAAARSTTAPPTARRSRPRA